MVTFTAEGCSVIQRHEPSGDRDVLVVVASPDIASDVAALVTRARNANDRRRYTESARLYARAYALAEVESFWA